MTQAQFMYELMTAVRHLSDEAQYVIMQDYNEYFFNKKEEGLSEEEIIASLPSPKTIASDYKHGMPTPMDGMRMAQRQEPPSKPTGLNVFLFILLIPVCAAYELMMVLFAAVTAALLLALCAASALASVACFSLLGLSAGFAAAGAGGLIVTVGFVLFGAGIFRALWAGLRWFPRYMNRVRMNKAKRGGRR